MFEKIIKQKTKQRTSIDSNYQLLVYLVITFYFFTDASVNPENDLKYGSQNFGKKRNEYYHGAIRLYRLEVIKEEVELNQPFLFLVDSTPLASEQRSLPATVRPPVDGETSNRFTENGNSYRHGSTSLLCGVFLGRNVTLATRKGRCATIEIMALN